MGREPGPAGHSPFMILAQPRSGSNYLSELLKAHPDLKLQIEPFSMHTSDFLPQDLRTEGSAAEALRCRCGGCFACDLRTWLAGGVCRGFKETTLFEKLPLLQEWMPRLRVVFLQRDHDAIVQSHLAGDLVSKWRLYRRYADHPHPAVAVAAMAAERDPGGASALIRILCDLRASLWRSYAERFVHLTVPYAELVNQPEQTLDRVMRFLGLQRDSLQDFCIAEHRKGTRVGTYGTFGGSPAVSMTGADAIHPMNRSCR